MVAPTGLLLQTLIAFKQHNSGFSYQYAHEIRNTQLRWNTTNQTNMIWLNAVAARFNSSIFILLLSIHR